MAIDRDLLVDSGMGVVSLRDWVPLVTERALTAVAVRERGWSRSDRDASCDTS